MSVSHLADQLRSCYSGRTVLVTGHTGFKGAWLCEWLLLLGARVVGIALPPDTEPALFDQLGLAGRMDHRLLDIRDGESLARAVLDVAPDHVFHLAAQPLVRRAYREPVATYDTNVMGTVHLLEALRALNACYGDTGRCCTAVLVTTDKCYENREWLHAYRECDPLGGHDPYSASKAACELAIASYRRSFFDPRLCAGRLCVSIASARAGNVIGGGDWAPDRIVPDCIRNLRRGAPIDVRNPAATRPWQHVLEALHGYMLLGLHQQRALAATDVDALATYGDAFNFGPGLTANRPVRHLVEAVLREWPGDWRDARNGQADPHEARQLSLAWDKAFHCLHWAPRWGFAETVRRTVSWYRQALETPGRAAELVRTDILAYQQDDAAADSAPGELLQT